MTFTDLFQWIVIIGGTMGLALFGMIQWLKYLREEEQKAFKGEPTNSNMISEMWTCRECGAWNAPYLKRCGKCFNIKSVKNEK